jgi:hypothetical protein
MGGRITLQLRTMCERCREPSNIEVEVADGGDAEGRAADLVALARCGHCLQRGQRARRGRWIGPFFVVIAIAIWAMTPSGYWFNKPGCFFGMCGEGDRLVQSAEWFALGLCALACGLIAAALRWRRLGRADRWVRFVPQVLDPPQRERL